MTNLISREEAVDVVGLANVDEVDGLQCQPGRWLWKRGPLIEWSAASHLEGGLTLEVYYYTTEEDKTVAEATGDWSNTDWPARRAGYRII